MRRRDHAHPTPFVIPAQAGIHCPYRCGSGFGRTGEWIPASAGMTDGLEHATGQKTFSIQGTSTVSTASAAVSG